MKNRMIMAAVAVTVAMGVTGAKAAGERSWNWSPLGIGIAAPIQLPFAETDIYGVRFGGLFGNNADVYGIDAGLVSRERGSMAGIQAAGFTWANKDVYGIQAGVLANVVREDAYGIQAGFVNADFGEQSCGIAVGFIDYAVGYRGVQVSALNWDASTSWGLQVGVANYAAEEYAGGAIAAIGLAGNLSGFQVGVVNCANDATGCQIGLINAVDRMHGVQIGFINMITESVLPFMFVANASF